MHKLTCLCLIVISFAAIADDRAINAGGWQTASPRDEIRPQFEFRPTGGRDGKGSFIIAADAREGLDGHWAKTFSVAGGKHYRFCALRKAENIASPRRSVVARVIWLDAAGKRVLHDQPVVAGYLPGFPPTAEPEYPTDKATDADGWTEVSDTYQAPPKAARAVVELHLRWAARGRVEWSNIAFAEAEPPKPRPVRLAAIHYRPTGGRTPRRGARSSSAKWI